MVFIGNQVHEWFKHLSVVIVEQIIKPLEASI